MQAQPALSLVEHFKNLPDPRVKRTRDHELTDVLVIAICCALCGGESFNDMEDFGHSKLDWFKTFLTLPNGVPSHDTFNRVFSALDPARFTESFLNWTQSLRQTIAQEIVALDGKALRRASNNNRAIPYIVSAWAAGNSLVLAQLKVEEKSNEITAIPKLLRMLELSGCIVTIDAMGCQKKIAKEIMEADADYVLALKGNQETMHEEVKSFIDHTMEEMKKESPPGVEKKPEASATFQEMVTVEKDHGRHETRYYCQSKELDWFADLKDWEGLRTVGMVEETREIKDKISVDRRYFLSSLKLDVAEFARAVRDHWGVENKVHWIMDVCFGEDQSRARTGYAAENLATLRRLALNILKKETTKKRGIKGKQRNAGWNNDYLLKLLGVSVEKI